MKLRLSSSGIQITLSDHSPYAPAGPLPRAHATHAFGSPAGPSSRHLIEVDDSLGYQRACLVTAHGGPTTIHDRSALVHDRQLIVAVGPWLCALRLPNLDLDWSVEVDDATCFGVHYSAKHKCYLSHGELAIARVTLDGAIAWSSGGKDIFSEGFVVSDDFVEVVDFNHEKYRIAIATGASVIVP